MAIGIRPFDPARDAAALRRFAAEAWKRTTSDAFWRWRLSCPSEVGVVAHDDAGALRAVVFAIRRRYRLGAAECEFLETYDWFCRPEDVGSGLGVFVMRRLMQLNAPIVALGALPDAEQLLRRLGFAEVASGEDLWLPLRAAALRARGRSPLLARTYELVARPVLRPRSRASAHRLTLHLAGADPPVALPEGPAGVVPLPDGPLLAWLATASEELGHFVPFTVRNSQRLLIWGLLRLTETRSGRRGELLEWHAGGATMEDAGHALDEALLLLDRLGCSSLHATTTDPALQRALRRRHFRINSRPAALVWMPRGGPVLAGEVHLMGGRGDGAFLLPDWPAEA